MEAVLLQLLLPCYRCSQCFPVGVSYVNHSQILKGLEAYENLLPSQSLSVKYLWSIGAAADTYYIHLCYTSANGFLFGVEKPSFFSLVLPVSECQQAGRQAGKGYVLMLALLLWKQRSLHKANTILPFSVLNSSIMYNWVVRSRQWQAHPNNVFLKCIK